jgi:hypothetical protein
VDSTRLSEALGDARAELLCEWADAEARAGDAAAVREKLDLAAVLLREADIAADSEMGRRLAGARAALLVPRV